MKADFKKFKYISNKSLLLYPVALLKHVWMNSQLWMVDKFMKWKINENKMWLSIPWM